VVDANDVKVIKEERAIVVNLFMTERLITNEEAMMNRLLGVDIGEN